MVTLESWRSRMSEDMRLRDFRPRTQEGYSAAVRQFLEHVKQEPATLTDQHVRDYFIYLREGKKLAPSSINVAVHALRFFFIHTLQRNWPVFELLRVNMPRMLPVVLSASEVRAVLSAVRHPVRRVALTARAELSSAGAAAPRRETTTLRGRVRRHNQHPLAGLRQLQAKVGQHASTELRVALHPPAC